MREALLRGRDWQALAAQQQQEWFGVQSRALTQSRLQAMLEAFDFMAGMLPPDGAGKVSMGSPSGMCMPSHPAQHLVSLSILQENTAAQDGEAEDVVRCRFWRHIKGDVYEDWSEVSFAVDASRAAEDVEVPGSTGGAACGVRRRLLVSMHASCNDSALCAAMACIPKALGTIQPL
jgi:hypothetical protein